MIGWLQVPTPIGVLTLVGSEQGLHEIGFEGARPPEGAMQSERLLGDAASQLAEYFAGGRRVFELELAPRGTPFQQCVWRALLEIPWGSICAYSDIAEAIGKPGAVRAVGLANGRNPIPIIIPCHRVIGRDGSLTGYGGGLPLKKALLELEGASVEVRRNLELFA